MVVSITDSGMGNRIKSLLSVMRMTDNPKIVWPINRFGNNSFNDLFENDFEISSNQIGDAPTRFSPYMYIKEEDNIPEEFARYPEHHSGEKPWEYFDMKSGKYKSLDNGKSIDYQYNRIPQNVIDSYVEQVNKLVPVRYIRDEVERFSNENFDENTVTVQIRTWKDDARRAPMFDKQRYFDIMDKMENKNFFVTADDQGIIDELSQRYPNRVSYYQKRISKYEPGSPDSRRKEFGQDNLIDMYLLSKGSTIIGSHLSTFVEIAWWLGGAKAEVFVL